MTQRIEYTEEMVGNAHPTKSDTLNRLINVFTTVGDIIYATAAATVARLAKGTANQILQMNAGATAPEWISLPKFSAHKNGTNQTGVVTATWTKVTFTTEEYDVGSAYDAANSKWVPGIIGKVHVMAVLLYLNCVDQTYFYINVYKNAVEHKNSLINASGSAAQGVAVSCDISIENITDYIEIYARQTSGVDQAIYGGAEHTWFMGHILP